MTAINLLVILGMTEIRFQALLLLSAFFRVFLILYGEWQDAYMEVRYTDVDYFVFSDAASLMASGKSPYDRLTYRYSPLIAFLLIPNSFLHRSWGKFLFSASDLLVGLFIHRILKLRGVPEKLCTYYTMVWLFNPFTFTIGTRGNCEPVVCSMILWILICLMNGHLSQAAFWYGLIVHLRIYPIIYALPIIILLDPLYFQLGKKPVLVDWSTKISKSSWEVSNTNNAILQHIRNFFTSLITWRKIMFGIISGSTFLVLTGLCFYLYGWDFLHEALLYHLTRTDPRHNFSIYFYHIYLHYEHEFSILEKLISFLPQFIVQLVLIFCFALDLPFCLFLQTLAFVAFNKVITAQYFVWFFCLLPLILPWSNMKLRWKGLACISVWIGAQTHWLMWGYLLEFQEKMGEMSGYQLGVIGALFLSVASSVSIVICNKALMTNLALPFATTLTSWHLMVTYCSLRVALRLNFFENKPIDMKTVVLFGLLNGVSIGFLNLSLGFNSIGFYQMTKLAIIPFTVIMETIFLNKQFSWHCIYNRSSAKLPWNHSLFSSHHNNMCWTNPNKHYTEEAKCVINSAIVPISPISSSHSLRLGSFLGPMSNQTERICIQIRPPCLGIHTAFVLDCRVRELQHILGDRKDITSDIPSIRPSKNMPCSWTWLYYLA